MKYDITEYFEVDFEVDFDTMVLSVKAGYPNQASWKIKIKDNEWWYLTTMHITQEQDWEKLDQDYLINELHKHYKDHMAERYLLGELSA